MIAVITFVVLFLITGSVVLPLKALILNVLSLTATFGALVWVFQDGHLGAPRHHGDRHVGRELAGAHVLHRVRSFDGLRSVPVVADSRVLAGCGRTGHDSDESVALGLARTGRVVTAAALLMTISFAALLTSQVFLCQDVRSRPCDRRASGRHGRSHAAAARPHAAARRLNWWAPAPLTRLHQRIGLIEGPDRMEQDNTRIWRNDDR